MRREHHSSAKGFTLIEVMLALVLVAFGLFALGATSVLVTRQIGSAGARVAGAIAARNRVEWLVATHCALLASGAADHSHGVRELWSVEHGDQSAVLRDSVIVTLAASTASVVVTSSRSC